MYNNLTRDSVYSNQYVNENIHKFSILEPEYMSFGSDKPSRNYLAYHNGKKAIKPK